MKSFTRLFSVAAIILLLNLSLEAQENAISNSTLTTCQGFLVDTGLSASDYSNNEDITMTICPEAGETYLNLYWSFFDIGAGDTMWIYDGDSTDDPLIGTYMGTDLQAQDITSSDTNPTGCLTVHWESDASGVGSFGAEISCGLPCIRPEAAVDIDGDIPWRICVDEEITLDGSPSTFAEGASLESWTWDFADGSTNTTDWPIVTHSFSDAGAYKIQLYLTDDNECSNNNLVDVLVYVSNDPEETLPIVTDVCLGAELDLSAMVEPVTWTAVPDGIEGGFLFIPDDQSECFSDEIIYNIFEAGATIETLDDFESFYINFEHSFMGDLVITFICPNGQSIAVHQQGGGGTYLGIPVDDGSDTEGVGWDYWWSPDATNGTWEEEAGGFGTLPSGTYDSVQPWSNLIGCPLNGAWTVEICDMWAIDNGFIFNWTVEMDPSLYPENLTFTPSFGQECDSTYWSGPFITDDGGQCNDITIFPDASGSYDYLYTATNNHGCTWEYPVTVDVTEVIADAGDDVVFCGDDIFLDGGAITNPPFNNIVYEWTPPGGLSNTGIPNPQVIDVSATTTYNLNVFPNGFPECADDDLVDVIVEEVDPFVVTGEDITSPCPGDAVTVGVNVTGGHPEYDYDWNTGGQDAEIIVNPEVSTSYNVTVTDACGEEVNIVINVDVDQPGTVITADDADLCIGGVGSIDNIEGGTGNYSFIYPADSLDVLLDGEVHADYAGEYTVIIIDDCMATGEVQVIAFPCEIIIPNVFTPNNDGKNDSFWIEGILAYPGSTLQVFNRWGNEVFIDDSYHNQWSPTLDEAADGTYYYLLELNVRSGANEFYSGHITILHK